MFDQVSKPGVELSAAAVANRVRISVGYAGLQGYWIPVVIMCGARKATNSVADSSRSRLRWPLDGGSGLPHPASVNRTCLTCGFVGLFYTWLDVSLR